MALTEAALQRLLLQVQVQVQVQVRVPVQVPVPVPVPVLGQVHMRVARDLSPTSQTGDSSLPRTACVMVVLSLCCHSCRPHSPKSPAMTAPTAVRPSRVQTAVSVLLTSVLASRLWPRHR